MAAVAAGSSSTLAAVLGPGASQPSRSALVAVHAPAAAPDHGVRAAIADDLATAARLERVEAASRAAVRTPARVWPAAGSLTGWFGERRGRRAHVGVDIDGPTGAPVRAAATGTVVHAGWAPAGYSGYGRIVVVDHGDGAQTVYAHLSRVAVAAGQAVVAGDLIGAIGTSGSVTGSHLHFEVRVGGRAVDPRGWLPAR